LIVIKKKKALNPDTRQQASFAVGPLATVEAAAASRPNDFILCFQPDT